MYVCSMYLYNNHIYIALRLLFNMKSIVNSSEDWDWDLNNPNIKINEETRHRNNFQRLAMFFQLPKNTEQKIITPYTSEPTSTVHVC